MSARQGRQAAKRILARELNDIETIRTEGDGEMAPKLAQLPAGGEANRVFVAGTCTEVDTVGDGDDYWRARISDGDATIFVYAGQYQPDAARTIRELDPPAFVAVVGKPRTFETDDGEILVSIRPEHVVEVDAPTQQRWLLDAAEATLDRLEGVEGGNEADEYRQAAIRALERCDDAVEGEE